MKKMNAREGVVLKRIYFRLALFILSPELVQREIMNVGGKCKREGHAAFF